MPQPLAHEHPYDLAHAKAVLTTPAMHRADPTVIFNAWRFLKEARGQGTRLGRLGQTHHMIRPATLARLNIVRPQPDPVAPDPVAAEDDETPWFADLSPAPAPLPRPSQRPPIPATRPGLAAWFAKRIRGDV